MLKCLFTRLSFVCRPHVKLMFWASGACILALVYLLLGTYTWLYVYLTLIQLSCARDVHQLPHFCFQKWVQFWLVTQGKHDWQRNLIIHVLDVLPEPSVEGCVMFYDLMYTYIFFFLKGTWILFFKGYLLVIQLIYLSVCNFSVCPKLKFLLYGIQDTPEMKRYTIRDSLRCRLNLIMFWMILAQNCHHSNWNFK